MSQSLARICVHLVFSTKQRQPFLTDRQVRMELHAVLGELCNQLSSPVITVGGVEDHVHIACFLGRTRSVSDLIKELKRESTLWIKNRVSSLSMFEWQTGYAAFSISVQHINGLVEYIRHQEQHHRTESFQTELKRVLDKSQMEYDERFLWD
ncbi:MAG TPA: IS200/IS605 family transposase [Planctomycetaceae bacterium]|nr:IS200/IS605 family transposase [Planctomycetaceae bacterium]